MTIVAGVACGDNKGFGIIVMICMTGARAGRLDVVAEWALVVFTTSLVMIKLSIDMTDGAEIIIITRILIRYASGTIIFIKRASA